MSKLTVGKAQPVGFYKLWLTSSLVTAGTIFAIDTQIQLGVAIGALHVIPVLMLAPLESRKWSLWVACVCTVLIIIKLVFWPISEAIPWMVYANRGISVLVVWVTLLLSLYIFRN